jgi:curved DNA-binding protein
MKYKDYYKTLGVEKSASADDIKKAYRKLAHKYHPDVSKEADAEAKFKEVGEAYDTLKSPEKRAAYDRLGDYQPGQDFRPPPGWSEEFGGAREFSDDADLSDFLETLMGGRFHRGAQRAPMAMPGEDYDVAARLTLEQAASGTEIEVRLSAPEVDEHGRLHHAARTLKVRVPKGVTQGERLRVPGKGGKGINGGRDGDLYLNITLAHHRLFRVDGHDLFIDLPLAPWEAVLGAAVEVPTLAGRVRLKVPPGTQAGSQLRLTGRGLPKRGEGAGDLYAIAQIAVPPAPGERERALYEQLKNASAFDARAKF